MVENTRDLDIRVKVLTNAVAKLINQHDTMKAEMESMFTGLTGVSYDFANAINALVTAISTDDKHMKTEALMRAAASMEQFNRMLMDSKGEMVAEGYDQMVKDAEGKDFKSLDEIIEHVRAHVADNLSKRHRDNG